MGALRPHHYSFPPSHSSALNTSPVYRDFEERMELVSVSPLDTVRNAVKTKIGKFTKAEIAELVTSMSATSVERHLRALCENGEIEKRGGGRSTYYIHKTL